MDLADVLSSLMIGPKVQRPVLGGFVDVYPLAIPDGEGLIIPIMLLGEIGFYNLRSLLVLAVPVAAMDVVTPQLAAEIAAREAAAAGRGQRRHRRRVRGEAQAGDAQARLSS